MKNAPEIENTAGLEKNQEQSADHYIVAIGASAGGLEAIHEFFDNMPAGNNLGFVIIQHLSPDYKSLLVELVSKHTHMQVFEAKQDAFIEKNCIYVIPNNKLMTMQSGRLQLETKAFTNVPNTAIDIFFHSLAYDQGTKSIGVILSGTGTDGTRGMESIKEVGGMIIVQDPVTAKFNGMPNSAIATGHADLILAPSQMPKEIQRYLQSLVNTEAEPDQLQNQRLDEVFKVIQLNTGHDFHYYKTPTIMRRLNKRMLQLNLKSHGEYVDYLLNNKEESRRLAKEFLIGVTRFFRDRPAFDTIYQKVFPEIVSDKTDGDTIKVWICACSTGEEAYSFAILLDRYLEVNKLNLTLKIFASDIDGAAVESASKGVYPASISKDVEPDILAKYFIQQGKKYIVSPKIRRHIVFTRHNVFKDPPFIKNDLVSCRNMLIYMNSMLQKKVLHTLAFALNPEGFLFLGTSEHIASLNDVLTEISSKQKIYQKTGQQNGMYNHLYKPSEFEKRATEPASTYSIIKKSTRSIAEELKDVLAEEYSTAAIFVDQNYELKEATGDFRRYLSLPDKKLNLNILKMVPEDLSVALHAAFRKAQKEKKKISLKKVKIKLGPSSVLLDILVKPAAANSEQPYTLLVITEIKGAGVEIPVTHETRPSEISDHHEYIQELEADLKETRLSLQTAVEGLESANEELQSGNEELLSANEELQSSNEELQSLNEELHTLNTEHQMKIRELIELNDDLNNYFRSTEIAQVFLDSKLRIRKFNPAAVKLINLIENDISRPISHISTNIRYADFNRDIEQVLREGTLIEKEVVLSNNRSSLMRILPFVRQDKQTDGVVITFVDISAIKDLDNIVKGVFNSSHSGILVLKATRSRDQVITDFDIVTLNSAAANILQKDLESAIGQRLSLEGSIFGQELMPKFAQVVETGQNLTTEINFLVNGERRWFDLLAVKLEDGVISTFTDITEKKEAEERLRRNFNELITVRENLKTLNAELENKVRERTRELSQSEERFRLVSTATSDAIWDWSLVENKIWWNENFYKITGYSADAPFTRAQWLNKLHPDDRKMVQNSLSTTINQGQHFWTIEYRFQRADGSYADILDRGYLLKDEYETPYRMLGSMMDVTELRNAEREAIRNINQRKFLAESMPLIIWTANARGQVNFLNQQFSRYSGLSYEEGLEEGWEKIIHPEDKPRFRQLWSTRIQDGRDFSAELRLRRHDGEFHWHLMKVHAQRNDQGELLLWLGTNTDINEQKLTNEILEQRVKDRTQELHKMNEELESSNIELQQFAFVASHDLKEPLRKINMFSLIVKDKYLKDENVQASHMLDRIISSSTRMTRLVNDLLDFSRLSISQLFEQADLNHIIREILSDLELVIIEKKAVFKIDRLPTIEAVPAQIRQVFQNIISNSIKFSKPDQHPVIKIQAEFIDQKDFDAPEVERGEFCRITVSDNGIGFEEQYANKIFTIFQRLHTKETYEGTGIGLAITKKIIEKHNGIITAKSADNEGASFILVLPLKQMKEAT